MTSTGRSSSMDAASRAMAEALQKRIRRAAGIFLVQAGLLIAAGFAALIFPLLTGAAIASFLGWMLLLAGIVQALTLLGSEKAPYFWFQVTSAALSAVVGTILIRTPAASVLLLVGILIVYLAVEGIAKIVFSVLIRPLPGWVWTLASGVLSILIAFYLIANPGLRPAAIGALIGAQLIGAGLAIGWMAWRVRKG